MVNRCKRKIYFEGIDTSWNRVKGGKPLANYYLKLQQNTIITIHQQVFKFGESLCYDEALDENHWVLKSEAIKEIIAACSGLYLEAVAQNQEATPGTIKLKLDH
jgi:hypothetical protein